MRTAFAKVPSGLVHGYVQDFQWPMNDSGTSQTAQGLFGYCCIVFIKVLSDKNPVFQASYVSLSPSSPLPFKILTFKFSKCPGFPLGFLGF